jgi:hypothetical protein
MREGLTSPTPDGLVACEEAVSEWWLGAGSRRFASRVVQENIGRQGVRPNRGQSRTTLGKEHRLINNRQGGRRRGRGGGGGGPPRSNSPGPGNRQDNRQRGNAAQLLEKYKGLARDAQMGGDRVQTEYYLQYADHYFRVLNENRARFEEQRRTRDDYQDEDEDQQEAENGREAAEREPESEEYEPREQQRDEPRDSRDARNGEYRGRARRERRPEREEMDEERIALDVLPPAISPVSEASEEEAPAPAPRARRPRRPRDSDEDIAPAA